MNDIMKIVQALEYSGILLKGVTTIIKKIKQVNKKTDFQECYQVLLLGNMFAGKGILSAGYENKKGNKI